MSAHYGIYLVLLNVIINVLEYILAKLTSTGMAVGFQAFLSLANVNVSLQFRLSPISKELILCNTVDRLMFS